MSKRIYSKEILQQAASESYYWSDMLRKLGIKCQSNCLTNIQILVKKHDINVSHFYKCKPIIAERGRRVSYKERLVYDEKLERRINGAYLRKALIQSGRTYSCEICRMLPSWNDKPLTLQVDHINMDWRDNREENLRFLCPNCHSQVTLYKAKYCLNCDAKISYTAKYCIRCAGFFRQSQIKKVVNRPELEVLLNEVKQHGYAGTARKYNVTNNTIKKWIKVAQKKEKIVK